MIPSSLVRFRFKLRLYDVVAGAVAPLGAMALRDPGYFDRTGLHALALYSLASAAAAIMALTYFNVGRLVSRHLSMQDLMCIAKAAGAAVALTLIIIFSANALELIPRSMPALHFVALVALWAGPRIARGYVLGPGGKSTWRAADEGIILIGVNAISSLYLQMLRAMPGRPRRVLAVLDDDVRLHGRSLDGHLVLGPVSSAGALVKEYAVHGVRVTGIMLAFADPQKEAEARERLEQLECEVTVDSITDVLGLESGLAAAELACEGVQASPFEARPLYWRSRRVFDILGASAGILLLSPIFLAGALMTWINVGSPLIFWQERAGRRGKKVRVHKFRTLGPALDAEGRILSDDERLSATGRLMRACRIDELPQLFDVIRGHMSLIGPRPLLPVDLPADASLRQSVRPGLTGWAQVHGGKAVTVEDKAALDEWYIWHASPLLDLKIFWLTIRVVISKRDVEHPKFVRQAVAFRRRQPTIKNARSIPSFKVNRSQSVTSQPTCALTDHN